jgi:hypothetical protein
MKRVSLLSNLLLSALILTACKSTIDATPETPAEVEDSKTDSLTLSRLDYQDRLRAFWLSQSIANWTGLQTEGQRTQIPFHTDEDWDRFGFVLNQALWGADDDTDIEYIYQHALETYETEILTPEQIRDQWLEHLQSREENYLWVSNESAFRLMEEGVLPPNTSDPAINPNWEQIDAQLTTEIFGLFAPGRPDVAMKLSDLPVKVTARGDAEMAAKFYIIMHSLAPYAIENISDANDDGDPYDEQVFWLAEEARTQIPDESYIAGMYDWVMSEYSSNPDKDNWEATRDAFYFTYVEGGADGYQYTNWYDSGSNFGLSMISLIYGEGDLPRTVRIGSLAGMDSDNPTATWGGLLGFLYGYEGVLQAYDITDSSDTYWISRTRVGFENDLDTFTDMAMRGVEIIDRVVTKRMDGARQDDYWIIPGAGPNSVKLEYTPVR